MVTSPKALLERMQDLETEIVDTDGMIMLYGPPGGGKTTLAMMLAQSLADYEGDIIFVDSAQGWVSLKNLPELELTRGVTRIPYKEYDDLVGIAAGVKAGTLRPDVRVVVLDEHSSMYEQVLDTVLRERLSTPANDVPREVPEWTDYRPALNLMRLNVEAFQSIPGVHVILLAHDKEVVVRQKPKVVHVQPEYSPKLSTALQKLMHVTAYVNAEISGTTNAPVHKRLVQAQPTAGVWAKSRVGGMPVRTDFTDFVERVTEWIYSDEREEAPYDPLGQAILPDLLPIDGIILPGESDDDSEGDDSEQLAVE